MQGFWVVNGDGGNLRELPIDGNNDVLGFNATGDGVLYYLDGTIYQRLLNGAPAQVVAILQDPRDGVTPFRAAQFSPDDRSVIVELNGGGGEASLFHVVLDTQQVQILSSVQIGSLQNSLRDDPWRYTWSQDGNRFAVMNAANQQVEVFSSQGVLVSSTDLASIGCRK